MRVTVIAPHPDDETLGMGGTLCNHRAQGDAIDWILATIAWEPMSSASAIARQDKAVANVAAAYPVNHLHWLRQPTTKLDAVPMSSLVRQLHQALVLAQPEVLYLPSAWDVHTDHQVLHRATLAAVKSFQRPGNLRRLLAYEVPSSTDVYPAARGRAFTPNVFQDITTTLGRKLEIMAIYQDELHSDDGPRSLDNLRALARTRGASVGLRYAEAFELLLEVG